LEHDGDGENSQVKVGLDGVHGLHFVNAVQHVIQQSPVRENDRMTASSLLRPFWQSILRRAWVVNLILFFLLACLRGYGLFGPIGVRMLIMLVFFSMWFLPWIFISKSGRLAMGLRRVEKPVWLFWGLLLGLCGALVIFAVGYGLFGKSPDNWYISIRDSWAIDPTMRQLPVGLLFLIYTLPAMIFSPVGEELFFRGMIHEGAREAWGPKVATAMNALAFGGVHLLHHGLIWDGNGLRVLWVSGLLWVLWMMGLSWLFTQCRQRSGSIWPAVVAHSAFNLGMSVLIFCFLL
jgi:membrane protease YdiL (CAAX protease family)